MIITEGCSGSEITFLSHEPNNPWVLYLRGLGEVKVLVCGCRGRICVSKSCRAAFKEGLCRQFYVMFLKKKDFICPLWLVCV